MFYDQAKLPDLLFAFSYGGQKIEDQFGNYRTIKVKGRGSTSVLFNVDQVQNGTKIAAQNLQANTLEVTYLMYFDRLDEIRNLQRQLKQFLYRTGDVPIIFFDDPLITEYGRLSSFDEDDVKIYAGCFEGKYEIYQQDPLKYSETRQTGSQINIKSPMETTPVKIDVTLSNGNSIQIKNQNTGTVLRITNAAIIPGDNISFNFDEGTVLVNGVDKTSILDLESDFENFFINQGDILECTNGSMTIFCREVYL